MKVNKRNITVPNYRQKFFNELNKIKNSRFYLLHTLEGAVLLACASLIYDIYIFELDKDFYFFDIIKNILFSIIAASIFYYFNVFLRFRNERWIKARQIYQLGFMIRQCFAELTDKFSESGNKKYDFSFIKDIEKIIRDKMIVLKPDKEKSFFRNIFSSVVEPKIELNKLELQKMELSKMNFDHYHQFLSYIKNIKDEHLSFYERKLMERIRNNPLNLLIEGTFNKSFNIEASAAWFVYLLNNIQELTNSLWRNLNYMHTEKTFFLFDDFYLFL